MKQTFPESGKPVTIDDFLEDLNCLCGQGQNKEERVNNTRQLLEQADNLLAMSHIINTRIKDGTLRTNICGSTRIKEEVDGVILERPVVDLVQQGGTMLGIGLLGYTYIMEKVGVRFRSMAGTSAGAINTLLLAAVPERIYREKSPFRENSHAVKSEMLAYLVANYGFSAFLDREGILGKIQCWLVKRINVIHKILPVFWVILPMLMLGASYCFYTLMDKKIFNHSNNLSERQINDYNFILGTLGILAVILIVIISVFSLFRKHMGFNPGKKPYEWMKTILETKYVNVYTSDDLMDHKKKETQPIYPVNINGVITDYREERLPRIVFITANLTHNRIVKFPENSTDYWNKNYAGLVSPAAFVRASMSLPFIFYAMYPDDFFVQVRSGKPPSGTVDMLARFVDGGMLSNFPIREFHVPPPTMPNWPTFGVLLGSPAPEPGNDTASIRQKFFSLSVFKFIVSFISTFRNFYDSDFLRSHQEFKQLVSTVNTNRFNSLDFGMKFQTKIDIFLEGAKAAITQLENFDWQQYLITRKSKESQS